MAPVRSQKSLVGRRRRLGGDEDDEESLVSVSDSQSEGSILSEGKGTTNTLRPQRQGQTDAGAEGPPDAQGLGAEEQKPNKKTRRARNKGKKQSVETGEGQSNFRTVADTEAMKNGLKIDDVSASPDMVDFEDQVALSSQGGGAAGSNRANGYADAPAVRQRPDHEEDQTERDADSAPVGNRGTFFLHDTRGPANGRSGPPLRGGAWQGRGRGRGNPATGGPFAPGTQSNRVKPATEQPWKHDLHDTINEESSGTVQPPSSDPPRQASQHQTNAYSRPTGSDAGQPRVTSFSSTTIVGKVSIRVSLPGMKEPISFPEVTWKHYTRLPNHRPPLRRDKPVRISIPPKTQRYLFPSAERSFIFIPRQFRLNHGRGGGYQRGWGGYSHSSRRTSMYGGSMYAASVAASRRSSVTALSRADAFSPTSFGSGNHIPSNSTPVVRLPQGQQSVAGLASPTAAVSGHHMVTGLPQVHTYPLPQQPTYQGTPTTTVHQPRPQKAISVTDIESPAVLRQVQPLMEPQPFHGQLPDHMHAQTPSFSPQHHYTHMQPQGGTPLSGIAEQALQAPPFQPGHLPFHQAQFHPAYLPQQNYYHSPSGPNGYGPMPMYATPAHHGYMVPPPPPPPPAVPSQQSYHQNLPQPQPPRPGSRPREAHHQQQSSQSGMVAHEQNGMVFYMTASEAQQRASTEHYEPAESFVPSYAMPRMPLPAPGPESAVYYNPVQMPGMPGVYYPPQQQ